MTKSWANRIHAQPMFEALDLVRGMESLGVDVTHLEIGDTDGFDNVILREYLVARAKSVRLGYSPSGGEPRLREVVADMLAKKIGDNVAIDEIAIAPANFLILQAMAAISRPGCEILLPDPGFPTYRLAAEFLDLEIRCYDTIRKHLGLEGNDQKGLPKHYCPDSIVISNPNNPLGHGAPWRHYQDLIGQAEKAGSWIIFDETYINLCYDESMGLPIEVDREQCIRIFSVSKEHAAPGLRIGYCLAPRDIVETINRFTSLTVSCFPSFVQLAVADYLESDLSRRFVKELRESMKERFVYLEECFEAKGLGSSLVVQPNAGFYAMIRTPGQIDVSERILETHGIATCPGVGFGINSAESIRVSLAGRVDEVRTGIERLADVLADPPYAKSRG